MSEGSTLTPWLWVPMKKVMAAWIRAGSRSSGFRFQELTSSSERPARCSMVFCSPIISSKSAPSSSCQASVPLLRPRKPWSTASSPRPRPSMFSTPTMDLFIVISLSTASFVTTFSRRAVSFPKALPSSSSSESSAPSSSGSRIVQAMSVTDRKMVSAIFRTCSRSCSKGRRTMRETELESTSEKPTISTITTSSRSTFISESIWWGPRKSKSHTKVALSCRTEFVIRRGAPREVQGSTTVEPGGSCCPGLTCRLYGW
mmetsp:Transcript_38192/g.118767  ORF Transcript_38192/g.118767 Transcript_38192/m.118767 type:complete len:258 (-) Transcript_38192:24-797(-)